MTHEETLELLWTTGHFRNPKHPELFNVTKDDYRDLSPNDRLFHLAVQSYQEYFRQPLSDLTMALHHRMAITDGDSGPATEIIFNQPRCKHPDFPVAPEDDPMAARLSNREEANIPTSCRRKITVGRNFQSLPGLNAVDTHKVYWASCNNWYYALSDVEMVSVDVGAAAFLMSKLEAMSGGTLAWSELARNSCSPLQQAMNSRVNWALDLAITTKTHEDGHALGFEHNNDSAATMFPSINQAARSRLGFPNATDLDVARRVGYTVRNNPQRPPTDILTAPRTGNGPIPGPDPEVPPMPSPGPSFDCPMPLILAYLGIKPGSREHNDAVRHWNAFAENVNRGIAEARKS